MDQVEFSRPVDVERIGPLPIRETLEARPEEAAALARRFGLPEVRSLKAQVVLTRITDQLFRLDGRIQARVVQTCVVSLEPFPAVIDEPFSRLYTARAKVQDVAGEELVLDAEADDPPDPIADGRIDVGEAVAEQLALLLDPYPRKPGAEVPTEYAGNGGGRENPFAVLQKLVRPRE